MWEEYIDLRRNRKADDPDARVAHRFYLSQRKEMNRGAEVSNRYAFESKPGADRKRLEVSALQACFNLIDCGYCQDAICEFARRYGEPFCAAKGIGGTFRHGTASPTRFVGNHWFAQPQADGLWLLSLNADHWKRSTHDRFLAEPLDENGRPRPGSLSLFVPAGSRDHLRFAAHIVAEEWISEFVLGKGERSRWVTHTSSNHFLDATALCLAGAEMAGYGLFAPVAAAEQPSRPKILSMGHSPAARW